MSIFRRSEARSWTPEPIVPPFPGTDPFGNVGQSMDSALRISAVWACVRLIADSISMLPLHNYRMRPDGIRERIPDPTWLDSPDGTNTQPDWIYMMVVSMMLRGTAPGETLMRDSQTGRPTRIKWHNFDELSFQRAEDGGLTVRSRSGHEIAREDQFFPKAYRMPGYALGLSPIAYSAVTLSTDAEVQKFALGYFKDALHPASTLVSDQSIDQADARSIKERVMAARGSREPLVLGAGLKFTPLSVSPNESQFLDTQKWSVATICRIFGVPPEMVAAEAGNSMTYANVEQRSIDFLTYSVQPWLTRIEAVLATLLPGNQHLRFDTSALLRTDMKTLMESNAIGIASKQTTPDEARAMRDYAPLTEEQKKLLTLVDLTVAPTGRPGVKSPAAPPIVDFGIEPQPTEPAQGGTSGPNA